METSGTNDLVAEYRCNGLNQRITTHFDTDVSGTVDSNDTISHFACGTRWRMAARYEDMNTDPAEQWVFHHAGPGAHDLPSGQCSPFTPATTSTFTLRTEAEHLSSSLFCPPLLSHRSSRYRNAGPSTSSRSVPRLTPVGLAWSRKSSGAISYHAAVNWPAARTRFSSSLRTRSTSPPITGAHAGLTRPARTLPSRVISAEMLWSSATA